MARVIAVSNLKGGIGKTTTVVNIGAGLALKGARVLLVDVDAQGNLALALGVQPRRTIYEVLVDGVSAQQCIMTARPNLDLLPADHTLLGAQPQIAKRNDWSRVLEHALRPLIDQYDFILIDSAGSLTPLNVNALVAARDVIAPTAIEHFSIKSLELLFSQVARVKGGSTAIRLIVPTMYDPRVRQSDELLDELRARYGSIIAPPVRVNVRLSEASRVGKTIYEYDPRSRGAADYAQLVERLSEVFDFQPVVQPVAKPKNQEPRTKNQEPKAQEPKTKNQEPKAQEPKTKNQEPRTEAPPVATNGHQPAEPGQRPAPSLQHIGAPVVQSCPNCGHQLKHATLAGYHVLYCDNCHYKTQRLVREIRR